MRGRRRRVNSFGVPLRLRAMGSFVLSWLVLLDVGVGQFESEFFPNEGRALVSWKLNDSQSSRLGNSSNKNFITIIPFDLTNTRTLSIKLSTK